MPGDIDLAEASQTANGGESEYRRLCHLLIETCGRHQTGAASNENRDRDVRLALTVIEQHATSHAQSSSGSVESVIKWTIPRLVHAAINLTRSGTSQHLAHEIVSCIGTVIDTSCYHGPDTEQTPDNSQLRVLWILIHIFRFVDDVIEGRAKLLFGYKLPSQPLTCIFLLQMVVQHRRPFSERLRKLAFKSISVLGEQIKNDIQAQSSYMSMISSAGLNDVGDIDPWIMPLIWPTSNNELWISNQELLIRSLDTARPDVRFTLWSALSGRLLDPQQADKTEWFAIIQLTTSIEGFLEPLEIREYLGSTRIQVWQDKLRLSDLPDSTRAILNHNLSALVTGERHVGSGKRKRPSSGDGSESQWLLDELPELIEDGERSIQSGPIEAVNKLAKKTSDTGVLARICALLPRMIANHKASRQDARPAYSSHLELWTILAARLSDFSPGWRLLCLLIEDAEPGEVVSWLLGSKSTQDSILTASVQGNCRAIRAEASRAVALIFKATSDETIDLVTAENLQLPYLKFMGEQLTRTSSHKSIILTTLGSISRHARPNALGLILELLMRQLGSPSSPLRSLAYTNLLSICRHHSKSPMALISPYLEQVSIMLVASLSEAPDTLTEAASFLGQTRQNFIETTLHYTIPAMILARNRMCLEQMASTLPTGLGVTLLEYTAQILTKIFLCPSRTDQCLAFLVNLVSQLVHDTATTHIDAPSLITSCIVPLLVALVIELGDEEAEVSNSAAMGLRKVRDVYQVTHRSSSLDLGTFLKPHMLGVMTHLNETLHDVRGRKSAAYKRKLIRSLKTLIEMVGDSIASYSPQIMASLQSTLAMPELRQVTLQTWLAFIRTLRYSDIGPFVGRTTATLVANWASFDPNDRGVAKDIVSEIADNAKHLSAYLDDIVGLDHIPELRSAGDKLTASRKGLGFAEQLAKLLERVRSKNIAVATTSIRELRDVLLDHPRDRSALAEGDAFHPLVASTMQTLLSTSSRDAEFMSFCDMAYECLGIVGALDPDRCVSNSDSGTMTIMSNFNDPEESVDFAIHLVRDLLVDAFRATNDTKLQGHLAFAIQELLQFCGFSPKLLQSGSSGGISLRTRTRWTNLPKDQHETLTPLLESRFTLTDGTMPTFSHPIYGSAPTYREWLQRWTLDLIGQVMQLPLDNRATRDSQTIFGVFRGVLKNQDAAVAHHILPHLVLNVLLSGGADAREQISQEINAVLQDQVSQSSAGSADKRTWSAQVVFDLMDHLSKWQRLQRIGEGRSEKHSTYRAVDAVLSTIEVELMANAALQSKAYARALRGFEQRITQLRRTRRANTDLQTYFEKLHLVYANLNEPDGMEGVSTFVIAPSLEHQIREHESTGRWTSAQSCWEVRLQQSPNDVTLHQGLLHCLRNLGHYDTLRTHIRGILSLHPEWSRSLATFEAEAACITGEWQTIRRLDLDAPPIARLLLALHDNRDLVSPLLEARRKVGISITSNSYPRMYDQVMDLHLLREVEIIKQADTNLSMSNTDANRRIKARDAMSILTRELGQRFETLAPSFQVREQVLSIRRAAFGLTKAPELRAELGTSWIQSSKIARKSGYEQTAYSAILQAQQAEAPYAFTEKAKLLRAQSGAWKALFELENMAQPILEAATGDDSAGEDYDRDRNLAKVLLLEARWAQESDRFEANLIVDRYKEAIKLAPNLESPYYHLGHYYDTLPSESPILMASHNLHTCHNYILALQHGVKYIFQTMPRMLTLWLDLGEHKDLKKHPEIATSLVKITAMIDRSRRELASYQYFTAYPQIVSRIGHPVKEVSVVLVKIMSMVLEHYPQQALWPTIGVMQSIRPERKTKCQAVLTRAQHRDHGVALMIQEALRLGSALLRLTEEGTDKRKELSLSLAAQFPYVRSAVPSRMMVPLQEALTCTLPSTSETVKSHNPFPDSPVEIRDIDDKIEVMPSLQRPKKLVLIGTDGKRYPFLCKPHDDLRKDARLMDLNGMINKLLKSASDSRRRRLYIRTYAVMPLNEECGLLQWVSNTKALKSILEQGYLRQGKRIYSAELGTKLEGNRKKGKSAQIKFFKEEVLRSFNPTVFYEWFLSTWPEPSAWLASRLSYSRTLAVMSMIGYVLGLGDRHGENILFDSLTGDTVHVDLNCLFDKGKTFEIPEKVPFRLTQNMVDALGVTGVEGVFRKAAEIALAILRDNTDALMSVLEAFAHDPLVEWSSRSGRSKSDKDVGIIAEKNLKPIRAKLQGIMDGAVKTSVPNQVEALIKEATSPSNLGVMYLGWAAWL